MLNIAFLDYLLGGDEASKIQNGRILNKVDTEII